MRHLEPASRCGASVCLYWRGSSKGHQDAYISGTHDVQREVEGYGLVQPGREECGGDLIAVLNYLKRGIFNREDRVRLTSAQLKEEKEKVKNKLQ